MRMKMKLWISSTIFPFWVRKAEWAKGILLKKWTTHGRFVKPQLTKIRWNGHPTWRSMVSDTTPSPLYKLSTIKGNVQNSNTFASPVCADTICVLCNDMVEVVGSKCRKRQHPVLHGMGAMLAGQIHKIHWQDRNLFTHACEHLKNGQNDIFMLHHRWTLYIHDGAEAQLNDSTNISINRQAMQNKKVLN